MKRVRVTWNDHVSGSEWITKRKLRKMKPQKCVSEGLIFHQDKEMVILINTRSCSEVGDYILILKSCIKSIREI